MRKIFFLQKGIPQDEALRSIFLHLPCALGIIGNHCYYTNARWTVYQKTGV